MHAIKKKSAWLVAAGVKGMDITKNPKKNRNLKNKIAKEEKKEPQLTSPALCWELNQIICPSLDLVAQLYSIRL